MCFVSVLIFVHCWLVFSVQFGSASQSCPTLCDPMDCSTPGFPVHRQFLELTQTHVHRVSDAIEPCCSLLLMFSKSLIQFSIDGQGCVPSLLSDLRPSCGGGNEDDGSFKRSHADTATVCPWPCSRPPLTHASAGNSWTLTGKSGSVSGGHCSFLLGPDTHKLLSVPSKSLFPQSCVSSGGLMATSSERAYAIPRSTAPRAPAPMQFTADP